MQAHATAAGALAQFEECASHATVRTRQKAEIREIRNYGITGTPYQLTNYANKCVGVELIEANCAIDMAST